jgi:hypothetical protein
MDSPRWGRTSSLWLDYSQPTLFSVPIPQMFDDALRGIGTEKLNPLGCIYSLFFLSKLKGLWVRPETKRSYLKLK